MNNPFGVWFEVSNRDPRVIDLYSRHYSRLKNKSTRDDWKLYGISPPGKDITMLTIDGRALFGWIKQIRDDGEQGVNCYVFRNEGDFLSSKLIDAACDIAHRYWPGQRLFTFVNPSLIKSVNPGFCFKVAGFKQCGKSKKGLIILERTAP